MEKLKFFQELEFNIGQQPVQELPDATEGKNQIELQDFAAEKEKVDLEIKKALGKAMRGNRQFGRKTQGLGVMLANQLPLNEILEEDEDDAYKTVRLQIESVRSMANIDGDATFELSSDVKQSPIEQILQKVSTIEVKDPEDNYSENDKKIIENLSIMDKARYK